MARNRTTSITFVFFFFIILSVVFLGSFVRLRSSPFSLLLCFFFSTTFDFMNSTHLTNRVELAENAIASKIGYGGEKDENVTAQEKHEPSSPSQEVKPSSPSQEDGGGGYCSKIASTVGTLAPVYNKFAGAGIDTGTRIEAERTQLGLSSLNSVPGSKLLIILKESNKRSRVFFLNSIPPICNLVNN